MSPAAHCALHPSTVAVEVCGRCGTFLCADCLNLADDVPLCDECHRLRTRTKPSGRAIAALLLGVVGVSCFVIPTGLIGWILAVQERQAIDAGQAPPSGLGLTTAAKVMGVINLVVLLAAAMIAAGFYFRLK